jgi:hypothetical protein
MGIGSTGFMRPEFGGPSHYAAWRDISAKRAFCQLPQRFPICVKAWFIELSFNAPLRHEGYIRHQARVLAHLYPQARAELRDAAYTLTVI